MTVSTRIIEFAQGYHEALQIVRAGGVIAFPTDTVYGVGTAGLDNDAVGQLFTVKERPLSQAIPLLLADPADLALVCPTIAPAAQALAARYWPGGLTLVVPAAAHLPSRLLAGGQTVAVRVPDYAPLRRFIRELGQPLAATSANRHGGPNPVAATDVAAQIGARVSLILDGGATPGDIPSTIVDVTGATPRILRQGAVHIPS